MATLLGIAFLLALALPARSAGKSVDDGLRQLLEEAQRDQRSDDGNTCACTDLTQECHGRSGRAEIGTRRNILYDRHHYLHGEPDSQADQQQEGDQAG